MAISYLTNENIDFKKWDKCIKKAFNGTIYAYSWYLNIVSKGWGALIEGDYEKVMPLPQTRIAGIDILTQPKLTGHLGVFSTTTITEAILRAFFDEIPPFFRYTKIKLNKHNQLQNTTSHQNPLVSLDFDLIKPYLKVKESYPEPLQILLDAASSLKMNVVPQISAEKITELKKKHFTFQSNAATEELLAMQLLVTTATNNKVGQLCGIVGPDDKVYALGFFVWSHQKATLVFHIAQHKKLELIALFFLIDDFIRNNSEKNLILHFEINRNSKLVSFLEKIGAKKSESFYYYRNQLPWYLKPFVA